MWHGHLTEPTIPDLEICFPCPADYCSLASVRPDGDTEGAGTSRSSISAEGIVQVKKRYLGSAFSSHYILIYSLPYSVLFPLPPLAFTSPEGSKRFVIVVDTSLLFPNLRFLSRFRFFYSSHLQRERGYVTSAAFLYQPRSTRPILSVAIGQCGPSLE